MGSSASKAARKFPKRPQNTSWSGSRTTGAAEKPAENVARASETRNPAIEKDAIDPQFLSNLSRIGAVEVDHHMRTIETSEKYRRMYDARLQSEYDATSTFSKTSASNRVLASTLTELLDLRKSASQREIQSICQQYNIDYAKLESLARHVNSPSAKEGTTFRTVNEQGQEEFTTMAAWIQPSFK